MKKVSLAIASAALLIFASLVSFGQNQVGETVVIPSRSFELLAQPDSPLAVSFDNKMASRLPGAALTIKNTSTTTINSFVILINGEKQDHTYTVFLMAKGIAPGAAQLQGVSIPPSADTGERPVISVDYVHFEDGRAWGGDTAGKSKMVEDFIEGHGRALSRLKELLLGQDDSDFMKALTTFRSSSFGEPVFPAGRTPRGIDFYVRGYDEIVNILRRMPTRKDEGEALAGKLEEMGKTR